MERKGSRVVLRCIEGNTIGDEIVFNSFAQADKWLKRPLNTVSSVMRKRKKKIVKDSNGKSFAITYVKGHVVMTEQDLERAVKNKDHEYLADIIVPHALSKERRRERKIKSELAGRLLDEIGDDITKSKKNSPELKLLRKLYGVKTGA